MSRRGLRIKFVFEPTRRGADHVRAAFQMAVPEQRRVTRRAAETANAPDKTVEHPIVASVER